MRSRKEIKKIAEELAVELGYNHSVANLHFINVADAFCIGYTKGAKETVIGFTEWLQLNYYRDMVVGFWYSEDDVLKQNVLQTEELYELYIKNEK